MSKRFNKKTVDSLLTKSAHRCCICRRQRVIIHHIDPNSNKEKDGIVLCIGCHDEVEKISPLTRKISKSQLRKYKRKWENFCKEHPSIIDVDAIDLDIYHFLNAPRINMLFGKIPDELVSSIVDRINYNDSNSLHIKRPNVLEKSLLPGAVTREEYIQYHRYRYSLQMKTRILAEHYNFMDIEFFELPAFLREGDKVLGHKVIFDGGFYGKNLKSWEFYRKDGVGENFPYLYRKRKKGGKMIITKIIYDPQYLVSKTAYGDFRGRRKLSGFGIIKYIEPHLNKEEYVIVISPLAIGLKTKFW